MRNFAGARIYVAGSTGMVGSSVVQALRARGCTAVLTSPSDQLDLRDQSATRKFFSEAKPEIVILAAAKVGGIAANDQLRADFIYQNLLIEANAIGAAFEAKTEKLIFLGSSCIYPRLAAQPIPEEALLTGTLEATNEPYAVAKIAGIKLCESFYRQYGSNFFSVMPTNLYGPHDNFDLSTAHVIPALMRRFHEAMAAGAPEVSVWGSGAPRREFLFVDDLAAAIVTLAEEVDAADIYARGISHVNIGSGADLPIAELAALIADVVGYRGSVVFDTDKPDGTPRKLLDSRRINELGWAASTPLREGLDATYTWFRENHASLRNQR